MIANEIVRAKARLGLPPEASVICCYEHVRLHALRVDAPRISHDRSAAVRRRRVHRHAVVADVSADDARDVQAKSIPCSRSGGITFDQFISQLKRLGFAEPWHFAPGTANVQADAGCEEHRRRDSHLHAGCGVRRRLRSVRQRRHWPDAGRSRMQPERPRGRRFRRARRHGSRSRQPHREPEVPVLHSPVDAAGSFEPVTRRMP
jgi:hypothetical protein